MTDDLMHGGGVSAPPSPAAEAQTEATTPPFAATAHFNDLLRTATRHLKRLADCRRVRLWIERRGGRRLVARDFTDDHDTVAAEHRLARGEGLAGLAMTTRRTVRVDRGAERPPIAGEVEPFEDALAIPLFRRGEPFAVIECLDHRGAPYTPADVERLEDTAESVAFALDNALLYEETERRALEKEVLLDIATSLAAPLELEEVITEFFESLRQVVAYDAAAIYLVNRSTQALELVSESGYPEGSEDAFQLQVGQGIVGWVANTGEAVIVPDVRRDRRYVAARADTRSELAAPLRVGGRVIGVFNLESDQDDAYHEGHLEMVSAFASQAAVAVERARLTRERVDQRRLEKELAIAREIQRSFLPVSAPVLPGFDLAGFNMPHDEVGGDYYDFIPVSDARFGLAIADVAGKGIPAALIMAGFRMALLAEIRNDFAIRAVMRKVNSLLHESMERDKFVTAFYGVLDYKNRVLIFSNAGHNPPLLLRAGGRTEELVEGGVALGVLPDARFEERPVALAPGDLLVLYTDGVSEAEAEGGEQFGMQRLEQTVRRLSDRGAREIVDGVVAEVTAWTGDRGPNDDLTLVVIRVLADSPAA